MNEYIEEIEETTQPSTWDRGAYESMTDDGEYVRRDLISKYSWAIPNDEAIDLLVEESPILEIGAGSGYWAYLAQEAGAVVKAVDIDPPEDTWTSVYEGKHTEAADYSDRTLFLCWPSYNQGWAEKALRMYDGDTVIYVGEGRGGCTADDSFHYTLDKHWGVVDETITIPRWSCIHDKVYVFRR